MRKTVAVIGIAVLAMAVVASAQSPRENDNRWSDTGSDVTSLTVTNGMAVVLSNTKMILTPTAVAGGTNTITLTTPFVRKGTVILEAGASGNHIQIATSSVVRASGTISLVPGGANNTVVLYITDTEKVLVLGGSVY
jgi:hypothetical protein